MGKIGVIAVLFAALAASACTRSSNALNINTQSPPQPLPSQPTGTVNSGQLEPLDSDQTTDLAAGEGQLNPEQTPEAPTVGQTETEIASLNSTPVPTNNEPLTHEKLAGAWNVGSDNSGCRLFLSFTQWSGGYRAGTLSCASPELASVSAWDVKGSSVVLIDSNGTQVATLGSTGSEQYSGTTVSGKSVSFNR